MSGKAGSPPDALRQLLEAALGRPGLCLFLTGAGVSQESGIPTFRGEDGYWQVGSRNYHAQELATRAAFTRMPEAVWRWYLHRIALCRSAEPNAAHLAIADATQVLGDRGWLITQNVDGLHGRAGSPLERLYEIHGNLSFMRCSNACEGLLPIPGLPVTSSEASAQSGAGLGVEFLRALRCVRCGAWTRPHVLWFDEVYDEPLFRFESSLRAASEATLLVVVGTTGATNLPLQIGQLAVRGGTPLLVINPEPNPFSALAERQTDGLFLEGRAGDWLPILACHVRELVGAH